MIFIALVLLAAGDLFGRRVRRGGLLGGPSGFHGRR